MASWYHGIMVRCNHSLGVCLSLSINLWGGKGIYHWDWEGLRFLYHRGCSCCSINHWEGAVLSITGKGLFYQSLGRGCSINQSLGREGAVDIVAACLCLRVNASRPSRSNHLFFDETSRSSVDLLCRNIKQATGPLCRF